MKVAAVQHDVVWEDRAANHARLAPMIAGAAAAGARLVVLTEMFSTGFSLDASRIAEDAGGPSAQFLLEQARRHDVWVCGSVPERAPGDSTPLVDGHVTTKPFNTLVLAGPDGTVHRYRKIHPFSYAGEDRHYDAGRDLVTVDVDGLRVSLFVCYDLRFADEFWALAPVTDLYVVVANWPESRRRHWMALLQARAIENQAYVVGCNRVGEGGGLSYSGDSRIVDPTGELLATGSRREAVLVTEVDAAVVTETRDRFRFLQDRR